MFEWYQITALLAIFACRECTEETQTDSKNNNNKYIETTNYNNNGKKYHQQQENETKDQLQSR